MESFLSYANLIQSPLKSRLLLMLEGLPLPSAGFGSGPKSFNFIIFPQSASAFKNKQGHFLKGLNNMKVLSQTDERQDFQNQV